MVYNVTKYDGSPLATVTDSTLDTTSTSITLIGRNALNFGLPLNENFIALMQNFANTSPPPNPVVGQIWYDTVGSSLKVWDSYRWLQVTPPFDGNAGTAAVSVSPTVEVTVMFSGGKIICAYSHIEVTPSQLTDDVSIADVNYPFKSRFPNGLKPGMTMAQDPNGYRLFGIASTANALATGRNITINGSASGSTVFDGSNDVVITTNLVNTLNSTINTSSYWTKVQVAGNGIVTDANLLVDQDVFSALNYAPPSQVVLSGHAMGNSIANGTVFTVNVTLSNTTVSPGTYSNVTVDSSGRVVAGNNQSPVPLQSIMLLPVSTVIPTGWYLCNGQTVIIGNNTYTTLDLSASQVPGTIYIQRII